MSPRGLRIGAIRMAGERGSKEARAAARPAILPVGGLVAGRGVRGVVEGEAC